MKTFPLYNGDLSYMSIDHLKYVIPAIVCLIVIILHRKNRPKSYANFTMEDVKNIVEML